MIANRVKDSEGGSDLRIESIELYLEQSETIQALKAYGSKVSVMSEGDTVREFVCYADQNMVWDGKTAGSLVKFFDSHGPFTVKELSRMDDEAWRVLKRGKVLRYFADRGMARWTVLVFLVPDMMVPVATAPVATVSAQERLLREALNDSVGRVGCLEASLLLAGLATLAVLGVGSFTLAACGFASGNIDFGMGGAFGFCVVLVLLFFYFSLVRQKHDETHLRRMYSTYSRLVVEVGGDRNSVLAALLDMRDRPPEAEWMWLIGMYEASDMGTSVNISKLAADICVKKTHLTKRPFNKMTATWQAISNSKDPRWSKTKTSEAFLRAPDVVADDAR
jgi:hypothetical protein